ncbi:MAG: hypothetical protein WKF72_11080, partial [Nocardioidaceae bacterium]
IVDLKTLQPDGTYADPAQAKARAEDQAAATPTPTPSTDAAADVLATADYLTVEDESDESAK